MADRELKPCPFCGGKAEYQERNEIHSFFSDKIYAFVICKSCNNRTAGYYMSTKYCAYDEAADAWNRRANND